MNLIARIHDKEYEIAQGATFSEEYNETLDSGAIRIPHIYQIENLRPYDDVYIYESGYDFNEYITLWRQGGNLHDGAKDENGDIYDSSDPNVRRVPFYRHLLVNQFTEEIVTLDAINPETGENVGIFSYSIELFSETKGLEMVQVPNCSVTQPLNIKKKTDIYTYLCRFVNRYSPKYKTVDRTNSQPIMTLQSEDETVRGLKWTYAKKYSVAPELKEVFGGVYSQDFTLSNPTLKDVLSTLMITKDMIPYVKDNVVYAKDITKRTGAYDVIGEKETGRINMAVGQMSSADYCDGVRRQYSNALSQSGVCRFIEHLGFRNKNNSLITIDNMQVETTHPIYKIKKMYMCYYKKAHIRGYDKNDNKINSNMWFLCKQDITPLIKPQSEWGLLSQDWRDLQENPPVSIYDLSRYKLTTVTYDLGGTTIAGWGTRYNEYKEGTFSVYDITKTYIENIFRFVDKHTPYGVSSEQELKEYYKSHYNTEIDDITKISAIVSYPSDSTIPNFLSHVYSPDDSNVNSVLKFKTFFFEIEYSGFYDGALIHSRDKGNDNLFQNDNQSSSLTLLEKDGFSQKEKLNRFANKAYTMKGRLDGSNYGVDKLLKLGQTGQIGEDDDVIIYRREYSIFDNYILVSYAGVQDYVLKNFYTSVYARYRTNQLMSYGESTNRSETEKVMFVLSKDKFYKDDETPFKIFDINNNDRTNEILFSAFNANDTDKSINSATITLNNQKDYFVDLQSFTSGNSLCFNVAMTDNVSGGNYIEKWVTEYEELMYQPSEDADYYVGATQKWHNVVDDIETGEIKDMGFMVSHFENQGELLVSSPYAEYLRSQNLPKSTDTDYTNNHYRVLLLKNDVYKDNKDRIDMTLQMETIPNPKQGIFCGEYLMRLSDLVSYNKYEEQKEINGVVEANKNDQFTFDFWEELDNASSYQHIVIRSEDEDPISTKERVEALIRALKNTPSKTMKFRATFSAETTLGLFFVADSVTYGQVNVPGANTIDYLELLGNGLFGETEITELRFVYGSTIGVDGEYFTCTLEKVYALIDGSFSLGEGYVYTNSQKHDLIPKNMFVEFSEIPNNINSTSTVLPESEPSSRFSSSLPSSVFNVMSDGDSSRIRVRLRNDDEEKGAYQGDCLSGIGPKTQAINYWYFDFDSAYSKDYTNSEYVYDYKPEESGYHFVFGVNITESDINRGYVDVYITRTTHRDVRVFDSVGRQVGVVHNYIKDGKLEEVQGQSYDTIKNNVELRGVSLSVDPEGSGSVSGDGLYYKNEVAKVEFDPYGDNMFYCWKEGENEIKENPYVFEVTENRTLVARCGIKYNFWRDGLGIGAKVIPTTDSVELYKVDADYENTILNISAVLEVTADSLLGPVTFLGSFYVDPRKNVSSETAARAIVVGAGFTLKVWFENNAVWLSGYRTYFGEKKQISVNISSLNAVLINKIELGRLTLAFEDNIKSISYFWDTGAALPGEAPPPVTINREDEGVANNKIVISNVPYGANISLWAKTVNDTQYVAEYTVNSRKESVMGLEMFFSPVAMRKPLWESAGGIELTYGYSDETLPLPQAVLLDGLKNYVALGETMSTQYMEFVFDIGGEEKSIVIANDLEPIAISDEITFESRRLNGNSEDENGDVSTALLYVLLTTGATQPTVKLKKIFTPLTE